MLTIITPNLYQRPNESAFTGRVGDPTNFPPKIKRAILNGEIPDFFVPTPNKVTKFMIRELKGISSKERVLEPSAGYGHMIDSILNFSNARRTNIDAVEPITMLRENLAKKGVNIVGEDILEYNPGPIYDKVIMNPPFYEGYDILHVLHCFRLLKPGGNWQ